MFKILGLVLALMAVAAGNNANANIVYAVDRSFAAGPSVYGAPGSVSGTITTDGSLGFLAEHNIIDWKLKLSAGSFQFAIDPGNSFFEYQTIDPVSYGQGLFATPGKLDFIFGFSFSSLYTVFSFYGGTQFTGPSVNPLPNFFTWCIGTNFCANDLGFSDELILIRDESGNEGRTEILYNADDQETVATAAVPLPAGMLLAGTLWVAAGTYARQRRARSARTMAGNP